MIKFDYSKDEDGQIHFRKHNVSVEEVREFILKTKIFENRRKDNSYEAIGKLKSSGRYLKVIYRIIIKENYTKYFIISR